jgi:quaternary ammonium compound-resistance protein SugE
MPWLILVLAGLLEVGWAVGLKYTDGLTKVWPTLGTAAALILSVGLLAVAVRDLPLGTAYAVWTGIGTVGTVIVGIALFGESTAALRLVCVAAILAGIVGLKFAGES